MAGWFWTAKEKLSGKEARGWIGNPSLTREDQVAEHLKLSLPGVDFSQVKIEARDRPPDTVRPMPREWVTHGIARLVEEVEDGRRPNVPYGQIPPPLPDDDELGPELAGALVSRPDGSGARIVSIPKDLSLYRPRR